MNAFSKRSPASRSMGLVSRALLIAWTCSCGWFAVSASLGDAQHVHWWIPVAWLASFAALVALACTSARLGGLANRALIASCATFCACAARQDPADLPFRTSSILHHENGRMQRALLTEPTELHDLPCRSWCWWHADGSLDNVELAKDFAVQGHDFPEGTRLFFDPEGRLAHAWLSRDTVVDGHACRGGMKIDTAFHPNGRVRAFFPRRATEIDGVLCDASVFHPIYLHPDGRLRQCKLAADVTIADRTFQRGSTLVLDESRHAHGATR